MHTADIIIFAVFFLVNIIVGIIYRGKKQTFKEYAIGNKNFSTATIVATIVATWASGSMFFNNLEQAYSNGLYYIIASTLGGTLGLLIIGYVLAPRMGMFLNYVSMADAMGSIYGKGIQLITAISSTLATTGLIAIQFKVISKILSILFDYQGIEVTVIAAAIVILYAAFGGVKSVTFTDVVQFVTFGTLVPVLALAVWNHIKTPDQVIETLQNHPNFNFTKVISWSPRFINTLVLTAYYIMPTIPVILFQRLAMARNISQIKRSMAYSAGIILIIKLFIIWIAILILSENPSLEIKQVVGYMVNNHTYTGLKGFLGVGIIALAMSTADSALNSCAVLVTNDILPPLRIIKQASVRTATMITFIIGFIAILLTLYIQNILDILLLSANFYMPIITIPALLMIFGFRTSKRVMYIGMGGGAITVIFLLMFFKGFDGFFFGTLGNLVFLLASHYLLKEKGGWIKQDKMEDYKIPTWTWKAVWESIKNFKLVLYLEKCLPNKEYYYPLLAFYLLTAAYFSFYNLSAEAQQNYLVLYRIVQYTTMAIATSLFGFALRPSLLEKKRFLAWLWPSILAYTLFFVGGTIVMMSGFASIQVLVFMLNLVMAVLLSSWQLAIALAIIGVSVAALVFQYFFGGTVLIQSALSIPFQIGYGLLLFSSVLIANQRFKQAHTNHTPNS